MNMGARQKLLIVGNGEIAAMAHEYFTHDSAYEPVAFAIDAAYVTGPSFLDLPLLDLERALAEYPPDRVAAFIAIGDGRLNRIRKQHFERMGAAGYTLASYISSAAFVWRNVEIGRNCFILEHNVLQPYVRIGDNVTLWSGNHVGHRSVIGDHVFVSSHVVISGFCTIGACSFLGVNATLAHGVAIGADNYIAMAASVTASTEADGIYQGTPAERRAVTARRFCKVRE